MTDPRSNRTEWEKKWTDTLATSCRPFWRTILSVSLRTRIHSRKKRICESSEKYAHNKIRIPLTYHQNALSCYTIHHHVNTLAVSLSQLRQKIERRSCIYRSYH